MSDRTNKKLLPTVLNLNKMRIRNEVHTRCDFASKQFDHFTNRLTEWKRTGGSIVGSNPQNYLKKLNQANRVWFHYSKEFGTTLKLINEKAI